jgi:hypothetical protein
MRNVLDKGYRESQTHILCSVILSENLPVYETMWKNVVGADGPQITCITCMRFARWIPKTTYTHSEYVIVISFLQQQRLSKCAGILRHTCIACLVESYIWMFSVDVTMTFSKLTDKYMQVIHKSLRNFRIRLRNNQGRHSRKEHIEHL